MTAKRPINKKSNLTQKGHSKVRPILPNKTFLPQLGMFGSLILRNKENVLKIMRCFNFTPGYI